MVFHLFNCSVNNIINFVCIYIYNEIFWFMFTIVTTVLYTINKIDFKLHDSYLIISTLIFLNKFKENSKEKFQVLSYLPWNIYIFFFS